MDEGNLLGIGGAPRQHPLLVTKLELGAFGTFLVGGIGSVCEVAGSVTAWHESSALAACLEAENKEIKYL